MTRFLAVPARRRGSALPRGPRGLRARARGGLSAGSARSPSGPRPLDPPRARGRAALVARRAALRLSLSARRTRGAPLARERPGGLADAPLRSDSPSAGRFRFIYDFDTRPDPSGPDPALRALLLLWALVDAPRGRRGAHPLGARARPVAPHGQRRGAAGVDGDPGEPSLLRRARVGRRLLPPDAAFGGSDPPPGARGRARRDGGLGGRRRSCRKLSLLPAEAHPYWRMTGSLSGGAVDPNSLGTRSARMALAAGAGVWLSRGRRAPRPRIALLLYGGGPPSLRTPAAACSSSRRASCSSSSCAAGRAHGAGGRARRRPAAVLLAAAVLLFSASPGSLGGRLVSTFDPALRDRGARLRPPDPLARRVAALPRSIPSKGREWARSPGGCRICSPRRESAGRRATTRGAPTFRPWRRPDSGAPASPRVRFRSRARRGCPDRRGRGPAGRAGVRPLRARVSRRARRRLALARRGRGPLLLPRRLDRRAPAGAGAPPSRRAWRSPRPSPSTPSPLSSPPLPPPARRRRSATARAWASIRPRRDRAARSSGRGRTSPSGYVRRSGCGSRSPTFLPWGSPSKSWRSSKGVPSTGGRSRRGASSSCGSRGPPRALRRCASRSRDPSCRGVSGSPAETRASSACKAVFLEMP